MIHEIIRVWLYKVVQDYKDPKAKPSQTNQMVVKDVKGEFKYFRVVDGKRVFGATRKEASAYAKRTGNEITTYRGYPTLMYDLGYRG